MRPPFNKKDKEKILKLYNKGKKSLEIAKIFKGKYSMRQISGIKACKTIEENTKIFLYHKKFDISMKDKTKIYKMHDRGCSKQKICESLKIYTKLQVISTLIHYEKNKY